MLNREYGEYMADISFFWLLARVIKAAFC